MSINRFAHELLGSDLRSLGNEHVLNLVTDQESFDELFELVFHHERPLVMKAVDSVEKITSNHPEYLKPHKDQLLSVVKTADHKELKWHIAQLITRVHLSNKELNEVWHVLAYWTLNRNESKIVRVNSLQGLFDLCRQYPRLQHEFMDVLVQVQREMIPSIQSRVRKIKRLMNQVSHTNGGLKTQRLVKRARV